jgi:hypothetical protein
MPTIWRLNIKTGAALGQGTVLCPEIRSVMKFKSLLLVLATLLCLLMLTGCEALLV